MGGRPRSRLRPPAAFSTAWLALYELFYFLLKCLTRMLFRPLFRVRRVGPERELPPGGVIVCANHQSYLDPAMIGLIVRRRMTFVMTEAFYRVPLARSFFMLVGTIPVAMGRRGARASVVRAAAMQIGRAHV